MKLRLTGLALLLAGISPAAQAATVTVNHVMSPASVAPSNITGEALSPLVTLGAGDTLDMTITFDGGVSLQLANEDGLWPLLLSETGPGADLQVSGTLEFLGASGNIKAGPLAFAESNAFVHIGKFFNSNLYRLDAAPIIFSGIRQIITINGDDLGAKRDYQRIALTFFTGNVSVAPGIPEPATWAMMVGGFVLAGAAVRRRRVSYAIA